MFVQYLRNLGGEKTLLVINGLTVKQFAAAMGSDYDPLTKQYFTPKEIEEAKAAMFSLGFSKTLNGPIKLTDNALIAIEEKYGKDIAKTLVEPEANFAGRILETIGHDVLYLLSYVL